MSEPLTDATRYEGATVVITHRVRGDKHTPTMKPGSKRSGLFVRVLPVIWIGTSFAQFQG